MFKICHLIYLQRRCLQEMSWTDWRSTDQVQYICLVFILNVLPQHISCSWNCISRDVILFILSRVVFKIHQCLGRIWDWDRRTRFFFWQCLRYVFEVQKYFSIIETQFLQYSYQVCHSLSSLKWRTSSNRRMTTPFKKSILPASQCPGIKARCLATNVRWFAKRHSCWIVTREQGMVTKRKSPKNVPTARSPSRPLQLVSNTWSSAVLGHVMLVLVRAPAIALLLKHLPRHPLRSTHPVRGPVSEVTPTSAVLLRNAASVHPNLSGATSVESCWQMQPILLATWQRCTRGWFSSIFCQKYNNLFQGHFTASRTLKGSRCSCLVFTAASVHVELSRMHMDR